MRMNREEANLILQSNGPNAQAVNLLRQFMTCEAGEDFVVHTLIKPYWHTLKDHPVIILLTELQKK